MMVCSTCVHIFDYVNVAKHVCNVYMMSLHAILKIIYCRLCRLVCLILPSEIKMNAGCCSQRALSRNTALFSMPGLRAPNSTWHQLTGTHQEQTRGKLQNCTAVQNISLAERQVWKQFAPRKKHREYTKTINIILLLLSFEDDKQLLFSFRPHVTLTHARRT